MLVQAALWISLAVVFVAILLLSVLASVAVQLSLDYTQLELGQYLARLEQWQIANPVLRIIIGSTPDWLDVLAYALGAAAVLLMEQRGRLTKAARPPTSAP